MEGEHQWTAVGGFEALGGEFAGRCAGEMNGVCEEREEKKEREGLKGCCRGEGHTRIPCQCDSSLMRMI